MAGEGRVVIVTGANIGIGFETCKNLVQDDYEIILACRSESKALEATQKLSAEFPKAKLTFMQLDLSSLASIREFVGKFKESHKTLDILINNAGLFLQGPNRQTTTDGFELTMGTCHLGHFLLTNLLLDELKKAGAEKGDARIVVLASSVHNIEQSKKMPGAGKLQQINLDDLQLELPKAYSGFQAYRNAKAANILFTYQLSRRLEGTNVIANCLCPGFIPSTGLTRQSGGATRFFLRYFVDGFMKLFKKVTRTVGEGAADVFWLATSPEVKGVTGKYYSNGKREPVPSADETNDEEMQNKLWELSEQLVQLKDTACANAD